MSACQVWIFSFTLIFSGNQALAAPLQWRAAGGDSIFCTVILFGGWCRMTRSSSPRGAASGSPALWVHLLCQGGPLHTSAHAHSHTLAKNTHTGESPVEFHQERKRKENVIVCGTAACYSIQTDCWQLMIWAYLYSRWDVDEKIVYIVCSVNKKLQPEAGCLFLAQRCETERDSTAPVQTQLTDKLFYPA